jgi:DNA-binding XRE family transcriptional regulator
MFDTLPAPLKSLRTETLKKTQAEMADAMGMSLRGYQDIEADDKNPVRAIHVKAALFAMIQFAADDGGYNALPFDLGELVRRAAK